MNRDTNTNLLDDLNSPSIAKKEPEYSINNVFKPTAKNDIIVGMMMKIVGIGIVGLGSTLLAMVAIVDGLSHTLLFTGITMNLGGLILGAWGEAKILLKKEEPLSSLVRAAEDIKLDAVKAVEIQEEQTNNQQPIEPLHNDS